MKIYTNSNEFNSYIRKIYSTTENVFDYGKYYFLCKSFDYKNIGIISQDDELNIIYDYYPTWTNWGNLEEPHKKIEQELLNLLKIHKSNKLVVIFENSKDATVPYVIYDLENRKELSPYWIRVPPASKGPIIILGKYGGDLQDALFVVDYPGVYSDSTIAKLLFINHLTELIFIKGYIPTNSGVRLILDYISNEYILNSCIIELEVGQMRELVAKRVIHNLKERSINLKLFNETKDSRIKEQKRTEAKKLSTVRQNRALNGYVGEIIDDIDLANSVFSDFKTLNIVRLEGEKNRLSVFANINESEFGANTSIAIKNRLIQSICIPFVQIMLTVILNNVENDEIIVGV